MPRRSPLAIAFFSMIAPAFGQGNNVPVVSGISPPGATVGTSVEWTISGRNLAKVKSVLVSGGGVEVLDVAAKGEATVSARVRVDGKAEPGYREVRVDGPSGISNLVMVRIDRLPQVAEVEPNDEPSKAQELAEGSVMVGVLKARDLDHYRIKGTPGHRLTVDLEARRIGTSIAPVMTLFTASGEALAQGRESPGRDRDCRMTVVLPADGVCVVQVRDNVYGGGDQAHYRLRVDPTPYATSLHPLGGPRGKTVEVELSGGNLASPLRKSIALPDDPGAFVEPGEFDGPSGPVISPHRLVVGDGPEVSEPEGRAEGRADGQAVDVPPGATVNGRIGRAGEVDLYRVPVKSGEKVRFRVLASSMGSWLDSVLTLRDEKGATLAENDDSVSASPRDRDRSVNSLGVAEQSPDSALDYEAKADGVLTVEVADRFGDGGPEYGYRLTTGPSRPDFAVTLLVGNANANARAITNLGQARSPRMFSGQFGVFNLKPGSTTPINFLVTPEGKPGPVEVRMEGLPRGVTAEPVAIRLGESAEADALTLKITPYATPGLSEVRIVATSKGPALEREATATIGVDSAGGTGRPITRSIGRFPLRIVGEARPLFVGPPAPPTLRSVTVPGPLLQGDQLDLALDFEGTVGPDDGSVIEAKADGVGLATNTVISAGTSLNDDAQVPDVAVHVLASIKAQVGPHKVTVSYTPQGGPTAVQEVTVEVKSPIEVRTPAESIFLRPGDSAAFQVEVRREAGFEGEVELKFEGLPRGVKASKGITLGPGATSAEVKLEMSPEAKPIAKAAPLRVVGMARMPRGNVSVDSKNRPMIEARPADK